MAQGTWSLVMGASLAPCTCDPPMISTCVLAIYVGAATRPRRLRAARDATRSGEPAMTRRARARRVRRPARSTPYHLIFTVAARCLPSTGTLCKTEPAQCAVSASSGARRGATESYGSRERAPSATRRRRYTPQKSHFSSDAKGHPVDGSLGPEEGSLHFKAVQRDVVPPAGRAPLPRVPRGRGPSS